MAGETERLVGEFCAWWEARGHDATTAEGERIARELIETSGTGLSQGDVDAYCAKLKRGFAGGRTILAASEVGEALVQWLQADPGLDELSWSESADDSLLDGLSADDLPPMPEDDDLPPLPTVDDGPPLAGPDMSLGEAKVPSLDERVDAIGGRDVFAASAPPPDDANLQLDLDADMIGSGDKAHYLREEEMSPSAGIPERRASAAPVGHATSSQPPASDAPPDEDTREGLPALTTPTPPARPSYQPIIIGALLVLLIAAAAAATFAL